MMIEIAIDSIIQDNTAYTALVTLRRLGYAELARVERSEIVSLEVGSQPDGAGAIVKQISHAEVLFNPNKHRLSFTLAAGSEDGDVQWEALVTDRDDETADLVRILRGPFGVRALRSLKRGIAWRLHDSRGPASRERIEWACRELLANPYSQTALVRRKPARTIYVGDHEQGGNSKR